jgi:hypothetical protein
MSWTTNLVPKVATHSNEDSYLCVGCNFIPPFDVVHEEVKEYFHT